MGSVYQEPFGSSGVYEGIKKRLLTRAFRPIWLPNKQSFPDSLKLDIKRTGSRQHCLTRQKETPACSFNYALALAN